MFVKKLLLILSAGALVSGAVPVKQEEKKKGEKTYQAVYGLQDPYQLVFGSPYAPVTVIEYTALTCGHCAYFHGSVFPEVKKKYIDRGKIRFIFRNFPIDRESLQATALVNKVPAPKRNGVINRLFKEQEEWVADPKAVEYLARICELPLKKCQEILANKAELTEVLKPRVELEKVVSIEGTPTFFINGKMYSKTLTLEDFDEILCKEIPPSQAIPKNKASPKIVPAPKK